MRVKILNEVKQEDTSMVHKKSDAKVEQKEKQITNEDNVVEHPTTLEKN